jgi:hypothetical protein
VNDGTDQAKHESVAPEEALSRSRETVRSLETLLFLDRAKLAALEEQIIGMKMADASLRARSQSESVARTRELEEAVAGAERAEFEAAHARRIIESIHRSTTWRVMARVIAVLDAYPWLRRTLQGGVRIARRGLRAARAMRSRERGTHR